MNVGRLIAVLLAFCVSGVSIAETRKEAMERQREEWTKFGNQIENECIGTGEAWFSYAPLDKSTFVPVRFSPDLQTDLVKRVANSLAPFKDPRIKDLLDGPWNDAVNARIDALRTGTYNNINLIVAKGIGLHITPAEDQSDDVIVWRLRGFLAALADVTEGNAPRNAVYRLAASGEIRPIDSKSKPAWMTSQSINDYLWSRSGSDRMRLKKMTRCNYESLPKLQP